MPTDRIAEAKAYFNDGVLWHSMVLNVVLLTTGAGLQAISPVVARAADAPVARGMWRRPLFWGVMLTGTAIGDAVLWSRDCLRDHKNAAAARAE